MPFERNTAFADDPVEVYGKYHLTFHSETGQVVAHLFVQNGQLVAHVNFPTGLKPDEVTDRYWSVLEKYAEAHGFKGKLRVLLADR